MPLVRMLARVSLLTALGAAGLVLAFALAGTGCRMYEPITVTYTGKAVPTDDNLYTHFSTHYKKLYSTYVNGHEANVYLKERISDPPGYFTGTSRVVSAKGKRSILLAPFKKAMTAGSGTLEVTTTASGSQLVRVTGANRADALCLSLTLKTIPQYPTAVALGTFKSVGGTGKGVTLRAAGRFLLISSQELTSNSTSGSAEMWMAVNTLAKGHAQTMSTACKNAGKPPPSPPKVTATATLDGYVFAPAGSKSVPAGAQVFPDGQTISGAVGCGSDNNLFLVVTYGGPATKATGGFFGPVTTNINASVKAGKNLLPLGANLPNGSYSLKLGFASGAAPFGGNVFLQRSC